MPSRNSVKEYGAHEYYHVYNRGVEKRVIFLDNQDRRVFLGLIKKYLVGVPLETHNRHTFSGLGDEVQLLSYCLMPNHFHLLLYQTTEDGITKFMRRFATGYVMYFNHRYNRVGGLFQGKFKASRISADNYLQHISRYIHMNPHDYKGATTAVSSLPYYMNKKETPPWLTKQPIMSMFDGGADYASFLDDYQESKSQLEKLKQQLANNPDDDERSDLAQISALVR